MDGEDVLPILMEEQNFRKRAIGFRSPLPDRLTKQEVQDAEQLEWIDEKYKLLTIDNGSSYQLYDLTKDHGETTDVSATNPDAKKQMLFDL